MPVVLSKVFPDCKHTGSCTTFAFHQAYRFYLSNAKYYVPLLAIQLLSKLGKLNADNVKKSLLYYLGCTTGGFVIGWQIQTLMCIFRHIFGEYKFNFFVYVPSLLGALNIFWFAPRVQRLFLLSIFQCTLETILLRRSNILTQALCDSTILQTLIFMSCSALILHAKQTGDFKGFWILNPQRKETKTDDCSNTEIVESCAKVCDHEEASCNLYLIKGVRKYLIFGFMLDLVKTLLGKSKIDAVGFLPKLIAKMRHFKIRSTALLASYIGIYRYAHCYFNRKSNANLDENHNKASFVSGICYLFLPNLTLWSYAVVSSMQALYQLLKPKGDDIKNEHPIWTYMRELPITKIVFPFCLAHLIHNYTLYPNSVSNLAGVIIDNTTDYNATYLQSRIEAFRKSAL